MALLPHNKELVEKMKDKPFALVGVNSDGDRSVLQDIIQKHGINFRNAVDVTTSGKIATQYNVKGWPTVYVIDAKGIIRKKMVGVDPKVLDATIDELLKEMGN